jgi:hypothetical protein
MAEVQRIEKAVNLVIGKPLAWSLYGLWLATKHGYRTAIKFGRWLHNRYLAIRKTTFRAGTRATSR